MPRALRLFVFLFTLPAVMAACQPISPEFQESTAAPPSSEAVYPLVRAATDCEYGGAVKSIEATDARTFKITLCRPDNNLAYRLTSGQFSISDAGTLRATGGGGDELLYAPNGTGPWRLTDWSDDFVTTFDRFDDYWGEPALMEHMVIASSEDNSGALASLQAGEIDGIRVVSVDDLPVAAADENLRLVTLPPLNVDYLGINNLKPPFDNPRVRQALAMAIDREALVKEFYPPGSLVPTETLPPQIIGHSAAAEWYPYDPEQARAILAEEGIESLDVELTYLTAGPAEEIAGAIAEQLAEVGINATPVDDDHYEDYFGDLINGEVGELDYIGWYGGPDAADWYVLFGRDAGYEFGEGWPDIWEGMDAVAAETNTASRQAQYDALAQLVKEHVPLIPIAHAASSAAYGADVSGYGSNDDVARVSFAQLSTADGDTLHYMTDLFPKSAYCPDEVETGSDLICRQVSETLGRLDPVTLLPEPLLATGWSFSDDLKEWTFTLREGVTFHDGSSFDADDVFTSFAAMWDAADPLHVGNTGSFDAWSWVFGTHLNEQE